MSDSFADLWNSTAPSKPAPPPQKLGAVSPQLTQSRRPQNDVFSMLSSAGSSTPNSRPITPSTTGLSQKSMQKPPMKSGGADAFSGLLSGSLGAGGSNGANLTIAERAAKVERERREALLRHQENTRKQAAAWDGLDSLATPSTGKGSTAVQDHADDDWGFGTAASPPPNILHASTTTARPLPDDRDWGNRPQPTSIRSVSVEDDDWGLAEFSSKPVSKSSSPAPAPPPSSQDLWDLGELVSPHPRPPPPIIREPQSRSDTPGDFDFGNREDALLDDDSGGEDDILGALSKPVDSIPKRTSPSNNSTGAPPTPPQRTTTPPPHIIGQIVEMGFSPQQARTALAATDTGVDVPAALEMLLSNTGSSSPRPRSRQDSEPQAPPSNSRRRPAPVRSNSNGSAASPSDGQTAVQIQDQADKLLAQASEIGLSVFNRANAFWNTGKEKVQKAYEERSAAAARGGGSRGGGTRDGRPRWMQEAAAREAEEELPRNERDERDDRFVDDEVLPPKPTKASRPKVEGKPPPQAQPPRDELLGDAPVSFYVSPFRRGRPKPQPTDTSASPSMVPRVPSPIQLTQRQTISASTAAIAASAKHKAAGTEMYKLGRYAEAETSYSAAISALPSPHLLLVPLHNNRALTRLKTGDYTAAIDDCAAVITLIGVSYHPAREKKVERKEEGAEVDLADGLVKAWRRRAEAWEGKEKWDEARKDWEAVAAAEWAAGNVRGEAVRGAGRCRKMASANAESSTAGTSRPTPAKPPAPKPTKPPMRRGPTPPSQALNKLREANDAAEAEDQARHELKDTVDARLTAWKGGKETNIRALIASLDTVLWPELGWVKVGMGELVSSGQVKIRYTKAIAKLHPDKLNAGNTTVEQRMIANGVFGALNEAWNAFKQ